MSAYHHSLISRGVARTWNPSFRLPFFALAGCLTLSSLPLSAQVDGPSEEDEEVFELNPFIVDSSNDDRYLSNNSTSATGLNMQIRDLPVPVTVLNREYLDDLQADDMDEALRYTAGVYTRSYQSTSNSVAAFGETSSSTIGDINDPFQNVISIRGFDVPNQQRSGFRVGASVPTWGVVLGGGTDDITRERMEVVRGPQALLYGINVLSGVVNIIPKRPQAEYSGRASLGVGSLGYFRATGDFTGPILKDNVLNFRVMGSYQKADDKYEVDFRESDRRSYAVQLEWNPTKWANLLVEYVNSESEARGIGTQYYTDNGESLNGFKANFDWRNKWGERIRFGRDDPSAPTVDKTGKIWYDPIVYNPLHSEYYPENGFTDLGPRFNISGPDSYRNNKEQSVLALLVLSPTDRLKMEFGVYHTETRIETFNVALYQFTDNTSASAIATNKPGGRGRRNVWLDNPEVVAANGIDDAIGYGITEAFSFPQRSAFKTYGYRLGSRYFTAGYPNNPIPLRNRIEELDRKYAGYNWYKLPTEVDTNQLRGRVVYNLDTDLLKVPASHTFIGGYHFIEDKVLYVAGAGGGVDVNYTRSNDSVDAEDAARVGTDPFVFRKNIFDFEPIRYNGEALWQGGYRIPVQDGIDPSTSYGDISIARSGWRNGSLWYHGAYGIYQGKFWEDRITLIAGLRHDSYQVKEKEQLVVIANSPNRYTDNWVGNLPATYLNAEGDPYYIGYGDKPFVPIADLPDALNDNIARDIAALQSVRPDGTVKYNFDKAQKFMTKTAGIAFRIAEPLSTYVLYSEGVFPNTGLRDGNEEAIDAEQTSNIEVGVKYDLWDGKLSGSLSVYRIRRKNAAYQWSDAPYPAKWAGGELNEGLSHDANPFSPGNADINTYSQWAALSNRYKPRTYSIAAGYLERAFEEAGVPIPVTSSTDSATGKIIYDPRSHDFQEYGGYFLNANAPLPYSDDIVDRFWFVNYEQLVEGGQGMFPDPTAPGYEAEFGGTSVAITTPISDANRAIMRRAFEMAMNNEPVYDPDPESATYGQLVVNQGSGIRWDAWDSDEMNNASMGDGRFDSGSPTVTFSDETVGIDGQLIFSPTKNYQLIFEFSHQSREIVGTGFKMVDPIAQDTGINWGTEYDKWVYVLGAENFEDVTRPSTFNGKGVNGIDLSGVPPTNFSIWNRYDFKEGPLKGFALGGGLNWESSVATSIPIGNTNYSTAFGVDSLVPNLYPTPDRPSRYEAEAFVSYKLKDFIGANWSIQLNVRNLLDETLDFVATEYTNAQGGTEHRRIEIIYPGRSYRVSLTAMF